MGAASALAARSYLRHARRVHLAQQRLLAGSKVVQTEAGLIEYAAGGAGPAVLIVHGAGGGYDQGLLIARMVGDGFRWIAMSRFGYLRTPLPEDGSPAAQADAHAALLDALGISSAAIVGISAGGPSALQFALRHPSRCSALVLLSAVSHSVENTLLPLAELAALLPGQELLWWLMSSLGRRWLMGVAGVRPSMLRQLSPAEVSWLRAFADAFLPFSSRRDGLLNDCRQLRTLEHYPLANISAPTLVVHAADDPLVPFDHATFVTTHVPGARLLRVETGGHLLLGHHDQVRASVLEFLAQHIGYSAD